MTRFISRSILNFFRFARTKLIEATLEERCVYTLKWKKDLWFPYLVSQFFNISNLRALRIELNLGRKMRTASLIQRVEDITLETASSQYESSWRISVRVQSRTFTLLHRLIIRETLQEFTCEWKKRQITDLRSLGNETFFNTFVAISFDLLASPRRSRRPVLKRYYTRHTHCAHNRRRIFPSKSVNNGKFTISVEKQL